MKAFLLYITDYQHTHESKELIAVCKTQNRAIQLAQQYAKQQGEKLSEDDVYNLMYINQTQGYEFNEFLIDEVEQMDVLIDTL